MPFTRQTPPFVDKSVDPNGPSIDAAWHNKVDKGVGDAHDELANHVTALEDFTNESRNVILSGGGTISWGVVAGKFKWTARFILMPTSENVSSNNHVSLDMPTSGVTDAAGAERASVDGITLQSYESLWIVHTRGSVSTAGNSWKVLTHTDAAIATYFDDENAYLIATRNGDNGSLYIRNGLVVKSGRTIAEGRGAMPPLWGEVDQKPDTFAPTAHKTSHATGGADALTPADISAVASDFINIKDFGAIGDGATDDTVAIQAAINEAESRMSASDLFHFTPVVYFPYSDQLYLTTSTIMVSEPLVIKGASKFAPGVKSTANAAIFTTRATLRSSEEPNPNFVDDQRPLFKDLVIRGANDPALASQHGIDSIAPIDRYVPRITVQDCVIRNCGGNGINSTNGVSNRVLGCIIHRNHGDGIYLTGQYNTDLYVHDSRIRINKRGINLDPTAPSAFFTGFVGGGTVIEGNNRGTGELAGVDKPSIGIRMVNTRAFTIGNVYFEGHVNDILFDSCYNLIIRENYFDGGSNTVPKTYGGPPARRLCAIHATGANRNIRIEENWLYRPTKPADTTDVEWGTSIYGNVSDHLPVLEGGPYILIENRWINNPFSAIKHVPNGRRTYYESVDSVNELAAKVIKAYSYTFDGFNHSIKADVNQEEGLTTLQPAFKEYVWPAGITNKNKWAFDLLQRDSAGALVDRRRMYNFTLDGVEYQPGSGPILVAPDGTTRRRLTIDNTGALILVAV